MVPKEQYDVKICLEIDNSPFDFDEFFNCQAVFFVSFSKYPCKISVLLKLNKVPECICIWVESGHLKFVEKEIDSAKELIMLY